MKCLYIVAGLILIMVGISGMTFMRMKPSKSKELVRIEERKKRHEMEKWLDELRKRAFISINQESLR